MRHVAPASFSPIYIYISLIKYFSLCNNLHLLYTLLLLWWEENGHKSLKWSQRDTFSPLVTIAVLLYDVQQVHITTIAMKQTRPFYTSVWSFIKLQEWMTWVIEKHPSHHEKSQNTKAGFAKFIHPETSKCHIITVIFTGFQFILHHWKSFFIS